MHDPDTTDDEPSSFRSMSFPKNAPVRQILFEDYLGDEDPEEVLKNTTFSFEGRPEDIGIPPRPPKNENEVFGIGLPSAAMGDTPPDDVDEETWNASKEKPDDRMHNLWRAYAFGTDHTDRKDPRIRGQIIGEVNGLMYEAIHGAKRSNAPMGAYEWKARELTRDAIDSYDPTYGTKLSTWVREQLNPRGANALSDIGAKYGDTGQIAQSRMSKLPAFKRAVEEFKNQRGRKPSNQELAERLNISLFDIKQLRKETASEYDITEAIDEDGLVGDQSLEEQDAIKAVYASATGREQRVMEYMFPEILGGEKPQVRWDAGGNNWVADQLGVSPSTVTRDKNKIRDRIRQQL